MRVFAQLAATAVVAAAAVLGVSAGCGPDRHAAIPADAALAAEGDGKVTATAKDAGMVYVHDRNDNRLVYSGDVRANDVVTVDPDANRVMVNTRVVQDKTLRRGHDHRILFDRKQP